jgi:hypothetical protein
MAFSISNFKNVGHYFATGLKYIAIGVKDVVLFANKSQAVAPEVDLLVAALAGPASVRISDLAFHGLGALAAALEPIGNDATSITTAQTQLSAAGIQLDTQAILDIKAAANQIKAIFAALGAPKPTA